MARNASTSSLNDTFGCARIHDRILLPHNLPLRLRDDTYPILLNKQPTMPQLLPSKQSNAAGASSFNNSDHMHIKAAQTELKRRHDLSLEKFVVQKNFNKLLSLQKKQAA